MRVVKREWMSTRTASKTFDISPEKLRQMCDTGILRFARIDGGHYRIDADSIRELMPKSHVIDPRNVTMDSILEGIAARGIA